VEPRQMPKGPARIWSIVLMSLLCTVLTVVLLRHPGPPAPPPPPVPDEPDTSTPLTDEQRRAMYRAWPLFGGWPLPQPPAGTGQRDSGQEPRDSDAHP
jgi:hypothetical protein